MEGRIDMVATVDQSDSYACRDEESRPLANVRVMPVALVLALILPLLLVGQVLQVVWDISWSARAGRGWIGESQLFGCLVLGLACFLDHRGLQGRARLLRHDWTAWVLLFLAVAVTWMVGNLNAAASTMYRGAGPVVDVRMGLWGAILVAACLSQVVDRPVRSWVELAGVGLGLTAYAWVLARIPDPFGLLVVAGLSAGFAVIADRRLRHVLLAAAAAAATLLILVGTRSWPFVERRLLSGRPGAAGDPLGAASYVERSLAALRAAEAWGPLSSMADLRRMGYTGPLIGFELPAMSLVLGVVGTLLVWAILLAVTFHIWRRVQACVGATRTFGRAVFGVVGTSHIFAVVAPLKLLPVVDHFGVAFLSSMQMTVVVLGLLLLSERRCLEDPRRRRGLGGPLRRFGADLASWNWGGGPS